MNWFFILLGLIVLGLALYWLLVITEGVYLGRKVVIWLYDLTADSYDRIKEFDPYFERGAIAEPLLVALAGQDDAWLLDVATGTGRVPLLLLSEAGFNGRVMGVDASAKMLFQAAEKVASLPPEQMKRVTLIQPLAGELPFRDGSFDAVTCLEALEFFPSDKAALQEMARVLRPGGFLMASRRQGWESRLFWGRYRSKEALAKLLVEAGLTKVAYYPWQVNYDMVTAWKQGEKLSGP